MTSNYIVGTWTVIDRKIAYDNDNVYILRYVYSETYNNDELMFVKHVKGKEKYGADSQQIIHTINTGMINKDLQNNLREYDEINGIKNICKDKSYIRYLESFCIDGFEKELGFATYLYHCAIRDKVCSGVLSDEILDKSPRYYFNRWFLCVPVMLMAYREIVPYYVGVYIMKQTANTKQLQTEK